MCGQKPLWWLRRQYEQHDSTRKKRARLEAYAGIAYAQRQYSEQYAVLVGSSHAPQERELEEWDSDDGV